MEHMVHKYIHTRCSWVPLQVVRYFPGQKYDPHHDLFDICDFPQKPRRASFAPKAPGSQPPTRRPWLAGSPCSHPPLRSPPRLLWATPWAREESPRRVDLDEGGADERLRRRGSVCPKAFDCTAFPSRRHLTFLIYLNSMPGDAGGHTSFPRLNVRDLLQGLECRARMTHHSPIPPLPLALTFHPRPHIDPHRHLTSAPRRRSHQVRVQPTARTALVFNDVLDNGLDDERTEHGGSAPTSGVKYAINCWIRARPETTLARQFSDLLGM